MEGFRDTFSAKLCCTVAHFCVRITARKGDRARLGAVMTIFLAIVVFMMILSCVVVSLCDDVQMCG